MFGLRPEYVIYEARGVQRSREIFLNSKNIRLHNPVTRAVCFYFALLQIPKH